MPIGPIPPRAHPSRRIHGARHLREPFLKVDSRARKHFKEAESLVQTKDSQATTTPAIARQLLEEGNQRFVAGSAIERDYRQQVAATASGQHPFAVVLSCMDSRVPTEIVFDQGIGDIFNIRIAGNLLNEDILGSLEFGCHVVGAPLIVVLGHTSCGAIKGACDGAQLGSLTQMLEKIQPAIELTQAAPDEDRSSANADFVNRVVVSNVKMTCERVTGESEALSDLQREGRLEVCGAIYDVQSGGVKFLDH
jgi:carbonic anhydrase